MSYYRTLQRGMKKSHFPRKIGKRGSFNRRIIRVIDDGFRPKLERQYHATKGWRTYRA